MSKTRMNLNELGYTILVKHLQWTTAYNIITIYSCIKEVYIFYFLHQTRRSFICFNNLYTILVEQFCWKIYFFFIGVTDSKAVTGSKSTLDITTPTNSLVVIITGVATGVVFTVLVVCLFVTCKKKVICNIWYVVHMQWRNITSNVNFDKIFLKKGSIKSDVFVYYLPLDRRCW